MDKQSGLTPAIVREVAERTHRAANPAGLLVTLLENEGPKLMAQAESKAQAERRQVETRKRAYDDRQVEMAQIAAARERQLTLIDAMTEAELAQCIDAVIPQHQAHAGRWQRDIRQKGQRTAVRENRGLRVAVCNL